MTSLAKNIDTMPSLVNMLIDLIIKQKNTIFSLSLDSRYKIQELREQIDCI